MPLLKFGRGYLRRGTIYWFGPPYMEKNKFVVIQIYSLIANINMNSLYYLPPCWRPGTGDIGGVLYRFFLEKQFFLISFCILCYFMQNIEKCPFTCWLNGKWFLQIIDGEFKKKYGVGFWTCWWEISGDRVAYINLRPHHSCIWHIKTMKITWLRILVSDIIRKL